jgi:hypothetical protein
MRKLNGYKISGERYLEICTNHHLKSKAKISFYKYILCFLLNIKSKILINL